MRAIIGGSEVDWVEEYRRRAAECRAAAERAETPERRDLINRLAATWDDMARQELARPQVSEFSSEPASRPRNAGKRQLVEEIVSG